QPIFVGGHEIGVTVNYFRAKSCSSPVFTIFPHMNWDAKIWVVGSAFIRAHQVRSVLQLICVTCWFLGCSPLLTGFYHFLNDMVVWAVFLGQLFKPKTPAFNVLYYFFSTYHASEIFRRDRISIVASLSFLCFEDKVSAVSRLSPVMDRGKHRR